MTRKRALTGYRPTGKLHLGHWFGNLQNMLEMQDEYDAFYFIADWHALTSDWADTTRGPRVHRGDGARLVRRRSRPGRCTIYRQSDVPEVAELTLYFSMVTPMSWLERVPSYKEQREQVTDKDLGNLGFFMYPLLQAADITIVLADVVPVGEDQLPHLELTREVVRRFNNTYGEYLVEPPGAHRQAGRARARHRRSQDEQVLRQRDLHLGFAEEITAKVRGMITDPARKLKTDPGDPDICPLHQIHKLVSPDPTTSPSGTRAAGPRSAAAWRTRRRWPPTSSSISPSSAHGAPTRREAGLRVGGARGRCGQGAPVTRRSSRPAGASCASTRTRRGRPGGLPGQDDVFEGPFDLLLHLVARQKVDVARHLDHRGHRPVPGLHRPHGRPRSRRGERLPACRGHAARDQGREPAAIRGALRRRRYRRSLSRGSARASRRPPARVQAVQESLPSLPPAWSPFPGCIPGRPGSRSRSSASCPTTSRA
jgi:tryptophanyl-tRNA synthetase